ncbi:unnamed protein product [Nyctereutes procyonoides]|uniref:(raccoon dog) hypothetical protein n=1 Tax=Nyctereutes procyonoides TaxID=34880 RepID=A0A811ZEH2_NYCPR|nr:unnamed protein product [Nyctereutes procyonoides]
MRQHLPVPSLTAAPAQSPTCGAPRTQTRHPQATAGAPPTFPPDPAPAAALAPPLGGLLPAKASRCCRTGPTAAPAQPHGAPRPPGPAAALPSPPGGVWAPKALRGLPTLPPQPNRHAPGLTSAVSVACTPCPLLSAARSDMLAIGPCRPHRPSPGQTHTPRAESPCPWTAGQAAGKHLVVNETLGRRLCEPGARTQLQDIKPRTGGPVKKHGDFGDFGGYLS